MTDLMTDAMTDAIRRRRVLFVDDEVNLLHGLRRMVRCRRDVWDVEFAEGAAEALDRLGAAGADVVVSDMRMPGMDGAQLLAEIRRRHPTTTRIILSGHAHRDMIISAVGPTQQYLSKPCDADTLIRALDQVMAVRDLMDDPAIRHLLGGVGSLPKPPHIHERMIELAADPECRLADVVEVIESDVATIADVLRLVNSAYFGVPHRVDTVERAVSLLGLETIQALAVAGAVFRSEAPLPRGLDAAALCARGLAVGGEARRLATERGWSRDRVSDLFFAGLLHEVALPALVAAHPRALSALEPGRDPEQEVEQFGCTVSRAGGYLLGLWGFGQAVIRALAWLDAVTPAGAEADCEEAALLAVARRSAGQPSIGTASG